MIEWLHNCVFLKVFLCLKDTTKWPLDWALGTHVVWLSLKVQLGGHLIE
jgi:hypothetical protein